MIGFGYRSHTISSTPIRINVEGIKHLGKQDSIELVLYPSIKTPPLHLGNIGLSWGIGNGISAMVGPYPQFEKDSVTTCIKSFYDRAKYFPCKQT